MISGANISYKGWIGCGYIIINPENGAGAYMISGGSSGADIAKESTASIFDYLIEIADIKVKGVSEFEAERYAKNFRTLAKQVGNALLFASIVDTLLDDQKTNWEKTNKILADIISKVVVDKGISMVSGINPIAMLYAGLVVGLILTIAISISMIFIARSLVLMAVSAED